MFHELFKGERELKIPCRLYRSVANHIPRRLGEEKDHEEETGCRERNEEPEDPCPPRCVTQRATKNGTKARSNSYTESRLAAKYRHQTTLDSDSRTHAKDTTLI